MKVSKAIEILEITTANSRADNTPNVRDAINLGIEALKRCQYIAEHTDRWAGVLLPGETPEEEVKDGRPD